MSESKIKDFNVYLEGIIARKGYIQVSKYTGMFITKMPKK